MCYVNRYESSYRYELELHPVLLSLRRTYLLVFTDRSFNHDINQHSPITQAPDWLWNSQNYRGDGRFP